MKVVIDTNVLVSAVLKDRTPEQAILFVLGREDFDWIVSRAIMDEYKAVLARPKFKLPHDLLDRWFYLLNEATVLVPVETSVHFPRDIGDAKFLTCALSSQAEWLITGDSDFSEARRLLSTTILSVSQFINLVCTPLS